MSAMVAAALAVLAAAPAPPRAAQADRPVGIVDQTLGRFDRDTLAPVGPSLEITEPHAPPALSPGGDRLAVGLSEPGSASARVGLWIVDAQRMEVLHRVLTGIAVEAVAYPGVVAALTQSGELLVVDPASGAIASERRVGYTHCSPRAVQVGRTAVFVNEVLARAVEITTVDDAGRVRSKRIRLRTGATGPGCRRAPLVADPEARRVLVAGASDVAEVDVRSLRARRHPIGDRGEDRSAVLLPGRRLAVSSERGVRVLDLATWRTAWRAPGARTLLASGRTLIALGRRGIRAHATGSGRVRWRTRERASISAAAAGRVYVGTTRRVTVRDAATGRRVGSRGPILTDIRFAAG